MRRIGAAARKGVKMRDKYGRNIDYVRISVTDRCNMRCTYCMPEEGVAAIPHSEILTYDEIKRLAGIFASLGITKVKLTGGEPLVRKGIPELIAMLKSIPDIEQVTLTTNGTLLKEHMPALADAGLDAVNISIDALDERLYEQITRRNGLRAALGGLDAALSCPQLKVKVNCVPLAGVNDREWVPLAGIARDKEADVRFIEMMPIGLGRKHAGRTQEEILEALRKAYGEEKTVQGYHGNGPGVYVRFEGFKGRIGFISALSHKFCGGCNRVRLTSAGYLKPCLQYAGGMDVKALLRGQVPDSVLREQVRRAVYGKPAGHCFDSPVTDGMEEMEMSRIGG